MTAVTVDAILRRSAIHQTLTRLETYAAGRAYLGQDVVADAMGLSEDEADMYETTLQIVLGTQQAASAGTETATHTDGELS